MPNRHTKFRKGQSAYLENMQQKMENVPVPHPYVVGGAVILGLAALGIHAVGGFDGLAQRVHELFSPGSGLHDSLNTYRLYAQQHEPARLLQYL